jgi:peptidoglycan/LPS O-acetylase OafA/YrhL
VLVTFGASQRALPLVQFLPSAHLAELVGGVLLALALDRGVRLPPALRALTGTSAAAVCLALLGGFELLVPATWWAWPLATLVASPIVAHLVLTPNGPIPRALARPEIVWLGRRSYGFYLWHYAIVELLLRSLDPWAAGCLGFGATVLACALSWRFWERPFLEWKERFAAVPVREAGGRGESRGPAGAPPGGTVARAIPGRARRRPVTAPGRASDDRPSTRRGSAGSSAPGR